MKSKAAVILGVVIALIGSDTKTLKYKLTLYNIKLWSLCSNNITILRGNVQTVIHPIQTSERGMLMLVLYTPANRRNGDKTKIRSTSKSNPPVHRF